VRRKPEEQNALGVEQAGSEQQQNVLGFLTCINAHDGPSFHFAICDNQGLESSHV
jgi:hypothetical protein